MVYLIKLVVVRIIKDQTVGLVTNKLRGRRRKGFWYCPNICINRLRKTTGKQERRWQSRGLNLNHQLRSTRAPDCNFRQFFEDDRLCFPSVCCGLLSPMLMFIQLVPEIHRYVWTLNDHYRFLNSPPSDHGPSNLDTITMHHTYKHLAACILHLLHNTLL